MMIVLRACRLTVSLAPVSRHGNGMSQFLRGCKVLREQFRNQCAKLAKADGGGGRLRVGQVTASLGLLGLAPVATVTAKSVKAGKTQTSLVPEAPPEDEERSEAKFDWPQFLRLLLPHVAHLLAAIATALAVAMLNIKVSHEYVTHTDIHSHTPS